MKTSAYIIVTKGGALTLRKVKPTLHSGQVAVKINIEMSDKFFERFIPEATLNIQDHNVLTPDIKITTPDIVMDKLLDKK